jgi:hypothetical protein
MQQIKLMSEDTKEQQLTRIKCNKKFALKINELANDLDIPQLPVFASYCFEENIHEDVFCRPLAERNAQECSRLWITISLQTIFLDQSVSAFGHMERQLW